MKQFLKEVLISNQEITTKIKKMASWVNETYEKSNNLIIVGLLKGSIPFMAELIKYIDIIHRQDFMILSSYGGKTESSGNLKLIADLNFDVKNQDILLVEDIIDSGNTINYVKNLLISRKAKSVKVISLLFKEDRLVNNDLKIDNYGFIVPDSFLVGFGLDVDEKLRNLLDIYVFDVEEYHKFLKS